MIARVVGERLGGEDTRFDVQVLGIRLRYVLGNSPQSLRQQKRVPCWTRTPRRVDKRRFTMNYGGWPRRMRRHEPPQPSPSHLIRRDRAD